MFSPYQPNSCYESDYECICIMVNGETCNVPLNILSSVYWPIFRKCSLTINGKAVGNELKVFTLNICLNQNLN